MDEIGLRFDRWLVSVPVPMPMPVPMPVPVPVPVSGEPSWMVLVVGGMEDMMTGISLDETETETETEGAGWR